MSAFAQASATTHAAIPALFVSHGAPLFAIDAGTTGPALTQWGESLKAQYPGLRGVVDHVAALDGAFSVGHDGAAARHVA